jgi:hypothetical protein
MPRLSLRNNDIVVVDWQDSEEQEPASAHESPELYVVYGLTVEFLGTVMRINGANS